MCSRICQGRCHIQVREKAVHHLKLPLAGTSLRLFIYASSSNIFHGGPFTGVSLSSLYPNIVLIPLPCNSRRGRALPRLHGRRPRARRRVATVTAAPWRQAAGAWACRATNTSLADLHPPQEDGNRARVSPGFSQVTLEMQHLVSVFFNMTAIIHQYQ